MIFGHIVVWVGALRVSSTLGMQSPRGLRVDLRLLFGLLLRRLQVRGAQDVVKLHLMLCIGLLDVHRVVPVTQRHGRLHHIVS